MPSRSSGRPPALLLLGAALGAACALLPLVYLVIRGVGVDPDSLSSTVVRTQLLPWTANSVVLVVAVGATCLSLGTAIAWLLTCTTLPARRVLLVLSAMPLAVPSYVAAFGWLSLSPGLQGFWPTWLVLSAACIPYVVLPAAAAFRGADHTLVEVARASGKGAWPAWRAGLVPQVAPSAAAGALLSSLYALSDFGTPALMRHAVLPFAVERQYGSLIGRERAALLALVLVAMALVVIALERRTRGRAQRWSVSSAASRPVRKVNLGAATVPALVLVLVPVLVGVAVPVIALFRRLALGTRRTLDVAELVDALLATMILACCGGLLALLLASCVGVLAARHDSRTVRAIETLSFAGHALPGIAVGLSLVYLSLRVVPSLYQTAVVVVFAYAVLFLPKAVGAVRTAVAAVSPTLPLLAQSLGRSRLRSGLVTARLASPGVTAGLLLVIVSAMKELPATLMLRPSGLDTLATEIWSRSSGSAQGAAAPYALALVVVASIPAFLLTRDTAWRAR